MQLLVHLERRHRRRLVTELVHVRGYDSERDRYDLQGGTPAPGIALIREPAIPQPRGDA